MIDFVIKDTRLDAKVPDESFVPTHAPLVLDVIKDLDSETIALTIDMAIHQAQWEQVIDFLQRRRRDTWDS